MIMAAEFDLQDFLPYLLNRAAVRLSLAFTEELRPYGLSIVQWRVASALWHEGPLRLGRLAHQTSIEISTLSRLVAGIERRGLVRRCQSEDDGRAVIVELTEEGRKVTGELLPIAQRYESAALGNMTDEETRTLKSLLTRVYSNFDPLSR